MKLYYEQYNTIQGEYTHKVEIEFINYHFNGLKTGALILDISGGGGRFNFYLGSQGFRIVTCDINLKSLKHILYHDSKTQVTLVSPGSRDLPFKTELFDAALCIQVPALVENDKRFFASVYRLLKLDGILIVTITNRFSWRYVPHLLRLKKRRMVEVIPTYLFKAIEILRRARNAGFEVLSTQGYNWIPFRKRSNSHWIPVFGRCEQILGLPKIPTVSPWVIACFVKGNGMRDGFNDDL